MRGRRMAADQIEVDEENGDAALDARTPTVQFFDRWRLDLVPPELVSPSQPPSFSATSMAAPRSSLARPRPSLARAMPMPPPHSAAIASAEVRLPWPFLAELRCNKATIALKAA